MHEGALGQDPLQQFDPWSPLPGKRGKRQRGACRKLAAETPTARECKGTRPVAKPAAPKQVVRWTMPERDRRSRDARICLPLDGGTIVSSQVGPATPVPVKWDLACKVQAQSAKDFDSERERAKVMALKTSAAIAIQAFHRGRGGRCILAVFRRWRLSTLFATFAAWSAVASKTARLQSKHQRRRQKRADVAAKEAAEHELLDLAAEEVTRQYFLAAEELAALHPLCERGHGLSLLKSCGAVSCGACLEPIPADGPAFRCSVCGQEELLCCRCVAACAIPAKPPDGNAAFAHEAERWQVTAQRKVDKTAETLAAYAEERAKLLERIRSSEAKLATETTELEAEHLK